MPIIAPKYHLKAKNNQKRPLRFFNTFYLPKNAQKVYLYKQRKPKIIRFIFTPIKLYRYEQKQIIPGKFTHLACTVMY
ncbi:hypothetical protein C7N43_35225 [Sphingobacteriales bacterium UPWRP_1]|nr:hypothetical protein B6N25_02570 [Sphingobacteriales bacterium TSM_CSS]PSJ72254.1 hypothetical protein C7N43_35225 [Sphingobacteriales bacterium UPWRP_1]